MKLFFFHLPFLLLTIALQAQVSVVADAPYSFNQAMNLANIDNIPLIEMPFVDTEALLAEDALVDNKTEAYRFGQEIATNISPITDGQLEILPDGGRLYRLKIKCKKALSINLIYNHFQIPEGARFYLYNPDQTDVLGAFTAYNNKPHLQFATGLLRGSVTILEYYEPANAAFLGIINISKVVHGYRGLRSPEKDYGESGACNNNVNCPVSAGWGNQIRSVAMIIEGGFRACTGAMVNNTLQNGAPYFLTANHCLSGAVDTWVFMFNYESPICNNQDGPINQTVSGCTLLASDAPSDFALVELSEMPPLEYNIYYAGWSAEEAAAQNSVCIHHPSGDIKKISFNNNPLTNDSWDAIPNTHWRVTEWESGTTEPGSSGSPIFDPNHRIVGQLHGGDADCGNNDYDSFGKFSYSWNTGSNPNTRLQDWLDPNNTGTLVLDGASFTEPQFVSDASVSLLNIPNVICNQTTIAPQVLLRNYGSQTLNAATINLSIDGIVQTPIAWNGNLDYWQAELINIPAIELTAGAHTIDITVSSPNGNSDQNETNNQDSSTIEIVLGPLVAVLVKTDTYPEETSFKITNEQGQVVYQQLGGFEFNTDNFFNICLPQGCYTFHLLDYYGDGIDNNGGFELSLNNMVLASDFTFNNEATSAPFCIETSSIISADFLSNETQSCKNEQVHFFASYISPTATYQWTFEGGNPASSTLPNPVVTYNNAGAYSVNLDMSDNGTTLSQTKDDYIHIGINIDLSTTPAINPLSATGTVTVNANFGTPPYTYTWSNGTTSSSNMQTNLTPGNYNVLTIDANSCTASAGFTIESLIAPVQINDFTANKQSLCMNESVNFTLNVNPNTTPNNYTWLISNGTQSYSSNEPNPIITFTTPGIYNVSCQINDNFSTDELVKSAYITVIDAPQLTATINQPTLASFIAPNGSINITATGAEPFSYVWNVDNAPNSPTLSNLNEGIYSLTVTDAVGCKTSISQALSYQINDPSGIICYPVPSEGMPYIYSTHENTDKVSVEIYDAASRLVGIYALTKGNNSIPNYNATAGIYTLRISANGTILKTTKIVISR